MMGRQLAVAQGSLFYGSRLDDHVPADYLLRRVDGLLDFGFVREALAGSYSASGRLSVDPELMLRMLLVGYAMNVLVDTPAGVAIDVEAGTARLAAEVDAGRVMLVRAGDRSGYSPKRVAADTAFA